MISLRTNLSSIITQNSMSASTNRLNQAIERMSTGYKINHSSDNAANYSILDDMTTKLNAYDIASDNISAGMDMVSTAEDTISLLQDHASRIHALITQAQNGTYGEESLKAINAEVQARMAEIDRIYANTEYNGKHLFDSLPEWTKEVRELAGLTNEPVGTTGTVGTTTSLTPSHNGFIDEVDADTPEVIIYEASELANAIAAKTKIGIGSAEALEELANIVNGTSRYTEGANNCSGKTIILTENVDISAICADNTDGDGNGGWNPIGNGSNIFSGTFNGNGHKVSGLYIKRTASDNQGLFGYTDGELKNIGVEGNVSGMKCTGGLAGYARGAITNSYAAGNVTGGGESTGGLVGYTNVEIMNSYATGNVTGQDERTGGLAGYALGAITNSYATGNVTGQGNRTGGLVGAADGAITNCYATGNVTGQGNPGQGTRTGGLAGYVGGAITNCYATGNVTGQGNWTGGLAGYASGAITNCYATGNITGQDWTGGLAGYAGRAITNSYATGNITGQDWTGGLAGQIYKIFGTMNLENVGAFGTVSGTSMVGSFIGGIVDTRDGSNFATITITNAYAVPQGIAEIGFEGKSNGTACPSGQMDGWLENIQDYNPLTTLQVGIYGDESCQISFNTAFNYNISSLSSGVESATAYDTINRFLEQLSEYSTKLGAVQNRLNSALESTTAQIQNLTSSRSTIKDADIAKESSKYIQQQILQQAAATLMSTANQSPSIALQLI